MAELIARQLLALLQEEAELLQGDVTEMEGDKLTGLSAEIGALITRLGKMLEQGAGEPGRDAGSLEELKTLLAEAAQKRESNLKLARRLLEELGQKSSQLARGRKALGRYKSFSVSEAVFLDSKN